MTRSPLQLPLFEDVRCAAVRPNTSTLLALDEYDHIIIFYSGGKDSLTALLHILEMGVAPGHIELWHQSIDGRPRIFGGRPGLMDWPVTEGYVIATAEALGLTLRWQWKEGGFEGEMLRQDARTAACTYQLGDGTFKTSGGTRGKESSRLMFPQVTGDLSMRWCSSYLKIDVASSALCGDPRFEGKNILVISGERREESANRNRYAEVEKHKATSSLRRVDQWRAVIDQRERRRVGDHQAPSDTSACGLQAGLLKGELHDVYLRRAAGMGHDQTDRPEPLLSHRRLRKDIRRHHPARRERNTTGGAGGRAAHHRSRSGIDK